MGNRIDEELRRLKETKGIGTTTFARRCGLPEPTIYGVRRLDDLGRMKVSTFFAIARGLGISPEELYGTR